MLVELGQQVGMEFDRFETSTIHRLGITAKYNPRTVIARFVRRDVKIERLRRCKALRNTQHFYNVFVNEDLTTRARLFTSLRSDLGSSHVNVNEGLVAIYSAEKKSWIYISNLFDVGAKMNWT